jgi:hypothetical protein
MLEKTFFVFQSPLQSLFAKTDKVVRWIKRRGYSMGFGRKARGSQDSFSVGSPAETEIYAEDARSLPSGLSAGEIKKFQDDGWVGPFPFLSSKGAEAAERIYDEVVRGFAKPGSADPRHPDFFDKRPWLKSLHALIPEFYDIARHPLIVDRVSSLLGPDLMAWGLSMNLFRPRESHRWHVDVEHRRWRGVTVFVGLKNIAPETTLKVISGSHRVKETPQELKVQDDESAIAACRRHEKSCELIPVPLSVGSFFIFDGPLWHGSQNTGYRTRSAMIIQYSRPNQRIQIPVNWDEPIQWHPTPPPCVLVKGKDRWGVNRLVGRSETFGGPSSGLI